MTTDIQLIQDAANMGVLARQAIGNEFDTMQVDPKICANVALLVERLTQKTAESAALDPEERATLLQRIADLEASCTNLTQRLANLAAEQPTMTADADGAPIAVSADHPGQQVIPGMESGDDAFKGPGQT